GTIRVVPLVAVVGGKFYPSLPFELARIGMKEYISVTASPTGDIERISLLGLRMDLTTNRRGMAEINHRGPGGSFITISARDMMREKETLDDESYRKLAGADKGELLRDAFVLVGVTALGLHDVRPTPFEGSVPGLEIQGTVLDNILSQDFLSQGHDRVGFWVVFLIMTVGMFGVTLTAK